VIGKAAGSVGKDFGEVLHRPALDRHDQHGAGWAQNIVEHATFNLTRTASQLPQQPFHQQSLVMTKLHLRDYSTQIELFQFHDSTTICR